MIEIPHQALDSPTVGDLLRSLARRIDSDSALLDAQVLLAHSLGRDRTWIMAHPEARLTPGQLASLEQAAARLGRGEALPYVVGSWEFYGLEFALTPDVLIPRPETELLVDVARGWLNENPGRTSVADVGTGSGAIGVALAHHVPDIRVLATDISIAALAIAKTNATRIGVVGQITFVHCDLFPSVTNGFDLICANLPYIPSERLKELAVAPREPALALDGGPDGLAVIRRLLEAAVGRLTAGGAILLEIERSQGQSAMAAARQAFPRAEVSVQSDLAGRDRLLEIQI